MSSSLGACLAASIRLVLASCQPASADRARAVRCASRRMSRSLSASSWRARWTLDDGEMAMRVRRAGSRRAEWRDPRPDRMPPRTSGRLRDRRSARRPGTPVPANTRSGRACRRGPSSRTGDEQARGRCRGSQRTCSPAAMLTPWTRTRSGCSRPGARRRPAPGGRTPLAVCSRTRSYHSGLAGTGTGLPAFQSRNAGSSGV